MSARGNKHQEIITAALHALDDFGRMPRSIEDLAASAGMSPQDILDSFDSIESVRRGVIDHALVLMADQIRQGIVQVDPNDPVSQLKALSAAYFRWGANNRTLYRLLARALVDPRLAEGTDMDLHRNSIRELVMKKLRECQALGLIAPGADLELIIANAHSMTLGASSMLVHERRDAWYHGEITDIEELSRRMLELYIDQMVPHQAQPLPA